MVTIVKCVDLPLEELKSGFEPERQEGKRVRIISVERLEIVVEQGERNVEDITETQYRVFFEVTFPFPSKHGT